MKKLGLICFFAFAVLPLASGLVYALLYSFGLVGALSQGWDGHSWRQTLQDAGFWTSMGLSLGIATGVLVLATGLALWLVFVLQTEMENPRFRFLFHFPLAIPPMVAAFVSFQWLGNSGMLARWGASLGASDSPENFPVLINDSLYLGVSITLLLGTFPFLFLVLHSHFKSANLLQISDLASTLGANTRQIRCKILSPILLQRAAPTLLLYGIFLLGAYEVPLLLGRQNPAMISMFIHQKFNRFNLSDLPVAYVATVLYALLVMGLVFFFFRKKRGL